MHLIYLNKEKGELEVKASLLLLRQIILHTQKKENKKIRVESLEE